MPDLAALAAPEASWWALWQTLPDATPFQSPAWLLCWARHYAPDRTAAVIATSGGALLALLPCFQWDGALWLAGTGPSDYGDAPIAAGTTHLEDALLDRLAVIARERKCNRIDLRQLHTDSILLTAATPADWHSEIIPAEARMTLPLQDANGLVAMSPRWQDNIAYAWRKLHRAGAHAIECNTADASRDVTDTLLRLHTHRWRVRGEPGLFADALLRSFVGDVIPRLGEAGLLHLHVLVGDGEPIAVAFAMHAGSATHLYCTGFDPTWSRFGPGLLSIAAAIQGAASRHDRAFHLLRGRESYKYTWAPRHARLGGACFGRLRQVRLGSD